MVQASLVVDPDLFNVMTLHTLRGLIALVSKSKAHQHAFGATPGGCGGLVFLLATEKARTDPSVAELSLQAVTVLIFMGFGDYFLEENYDWSNQKALSAAGAVRGKTHQPRLNGSFLCSLYPLLCVLNIYYLAMYCRCSRHIVSQFL